MQVEVIELYLDEEGLIDGILVFITGQEGQYLFIVDVLLLIHQSQGILYVLLVEQEALGVVASHFVIEVVQEVEVESREGVLDGGLELEGVLGTELGVFPQGVHHVVQLVQGLGAEMQAAYSHGTLVALKADLLLVEGQQEETLVFQDALSLVEAV